MKFRHIILDSAQNEYESSLDWYLKRSFSAGEQFIELVEYTIELICNHPYRWRNEYKGFYELSMKKYPFSIIYTIDDKQELITIVSIYHHSRNPRKKYKK